MDFAELEKKIGFKFINTDLIKQAFTHRSYINENRDSVLGHNERLEFLGDAVLELVATDFLYRKFPEKNEGDLTSLRSALVNTNAISDTASELGFNEYLLLSKGESKDLGRARQYILANTFESFIGAVYLDSGYDNAAKFISDFLLVKIDEIIKTGSWVDAKSKLQEVIQEKAGLTPTYNTVAEIGPDHDKTFKVMLCYGGVQIAEGEGKSKQEAEQDAARKVLQDEGII